MILSIIRFIIFWEARSHAHSTCKAYTFSKFFLPTNYWEIGINPLNPFRPSKIEGQRTLEDCLSLTHSSAANEDLRYNGLMWGEHVAFLIVGRQRNEDLWYIYIYIWWDEHAALGKKELWKPLIERIISETIGVALVPKLRSKLERYEHYEIIITMRPADVHHTTLSHYTK